LGSPGSFGNLWGRSFPKLAPFLAHRAEGRREMLLFGFSTLGTNHSQHETPQKRRGSCSALDFK
jgi:hypothetical protein